MTQGISIEVIGESASVERMLNILSLALSPEGLVGFLDSTVTPYLEMRAKRRFANEGDDVSGKWAPLTSATQEIRANAGYGPSHPINVRTSELEDYITNSNSHATPDPGGAVLQYPGTSPIGELMEKFELAQKGDWNTVPRPVLGVNEADLGWVLVELAYYVEGVGRAMF